MFRNWREWGIDMNIQIEGLDAVTAAVESRAAELIAKAARGIAEGGKIVEGEAKALCPVSTEKTRPGGPHGELRQSITSQAEGLSCDVGTNKEYAMYVEFGTYKMAAQPYLIPALKGKQSDVIRAIKAAMS